jgi:hypothetical protein
MQTRMTPPTSLPEEPRHAGPSGRRHSQLRRCTLEDGLRLLHFSHSDRRNLGLYLRDQYRTPAWLSRLALRRAVPLSVLKRARPVPARLALALAHTPQGTRDLYIEGCILRIVAGSQALVDVLTPRACR